MHFFCGSISITVIESLYQCCLTASFVVALIDRYIHSTISLKGAVKITASKPVEYYGP